MQDFSQPIPEDVFGTPEGTAVSHHGVSWSKVKQWVCILLDMQVCYLDADGPASTNAVDVLYSRGDAVWYMQRDGTEVPATVVAVDMAVYPPSYGVKIGDSIRETEASRLKTRGSINSLPTQLPKPLSPTKPHASSQPIPGHKLQPKSSGASFGSFTDAPETFAYSDHRQPPSPSQHKPVQPQPATAQFAAQASQPHTDLPWWHSNGAAHMPHPVQSSGARPGPFQDHAQEAFDDDGFGDFAVADDASVQSAHAAPGQQSSQPITDRSAPFSLSLFGEDSATSFSAEPPASLQLGQPWSPEWWHSSSSPMQSHLIHPSVPEGASQQQGTSSHGAGLQQQNAADSQSFAQQQDGKPQALTQQGTSSREVGLQQQSAPDSQHFAQQHSGQPRVFGQQQSSSTFTSIPQTVPTHPAPVQGTTGTSLVGASPDSQSDFGSFTGHDNDNIQWGASPAAESAQDYITAAQQQAPRPLHGVTSALSNGNTVDDESIATSAASKPARLQHMDRSAPISMGLFGEESYEDPALHLPSQDASQRTDAGAFRQAAPSSPAQAAGAAAISPSRAVPSSPSGAVADKGLNVLQQPDQADFAIESASWPQQEDDTDDFSPTWQEAEPGSPALGPLLLTAAPNSSELARQHTSQPTTSAADEADWQNETNFAATWPQPSAGGFAHLPQRQAISGPIPLDLFDMEETADAPLVFAPQYLASVVSSASDAQQQTPAESDPSVTNTSTAFASSSSSAPPPSASPRTPSFFGPQEFAPSSVAAAPDTVSGLDTQTDLQGSGHETVPARQTSPGPVSLEIFGVEEREDEPLELPLQAAIRVLPTADSMTSGDAVPSAQDEAAAQFWSTQTQLMQACAAELTRAHHVWSQVLASGAVDSFQQDPNGALYLQALQQVCLVALLLQAAAQLHRVDEQRAPTWHHAFAEASRQSLAKITDLDERNSQQSLSTVLSAPQVQQQVQDIADQAHDWMQQQQPLETQESGSGTLPESLLHAECCKLCLLPLAAVQLPVIEPQPGMHCLASMEALWTHRVGKPLPQT